MKATLTLLFWALVSTMAISQTFQVRATLSDVAEQKPLPGAHATLIHLGTQEELVAISDADGQLLFDAVPRGRYRLVISFIGYQEFKREVSVLNASVRLGSIQLRAGVDLETIQVEEKTVAAIQKGDTTEFNADAYKTLPDASAEELIEKMPTVTIENGQVQAQGENVRQVLVDGKPFFGNDPSAALRNLPAEVIDKIQVFDQQSEQSQFTGFDDGNEQKTINIITRPNMRNGQFGKIYGGYGTDDRYQIGGNVNFFNGDQRLSIIGMSNNINEQNFSNEDLLGVVGTSGRGGGRGGRGGGRGGRGGRTSTNDFLVSQQDGITASDALGFNFSDQWGEKLEVSASYFFNHSDNTADQLTNQQFFDAEGVNQLYFEETERRSSNTNHRFNGRFDYTINERNSLLWRPTLSWQGNDGVESIFGENRLEERTLSQTVNAFTSDLSALNLNNRLLWRHRFEKRRRTLSVGLSSGYAPQEGTSELYSETSSGARADTAIFNQSSFLDRSQWTMGLNMRYTEPVGRRSMLQFNYQAEYQREERDVETFDFDASSQEFDQFNETLSNVFTNDYYTQRLGTGYNYRKGAFFLMTQANVQWAQLINEQVFPVAGEQDRTFWNVLPMAVLRYRVSRSKNATLFYRTNTQLPSIDQLQDVIDNSNPLQLSTGNPNLVQSVQHRVFARYSNTNTEKSSVFFALLSANLASDYIANSTYLSAAEAPIETDLELQEGSQLSLPVNLDGYYNLRSLITYGFPVNWLGSNLNLDLSGNYTQIPGLVNEERNNARTTTTGLGLTLSSNISDRIDFTISSRSAYNFVVNTLQSEGDNNFFNQTSRVRFNWIVVGNLIFRTSLNHQYFNGFSDDFDQNYLLWNMSLGTKLFSGDRGELSISVFDLLKQNNSLTRTATETFIQDVQTNVLQQYFMINFKYDLRRFKG